jgi:hypothetical protein
LVQVLVSHAGGAGQSDADAQPPPPPLDDALLAAVLLAAVLLAAALLEVMLLDVTPAPLCPPAPLDVVLVPQSQPPHAAPSMEHA